MRVAIIGSTAFSRGNRNPHRWPMSFLLERGTHLSAFLRRTALCFRSLRVSQPGNLTFPFITFRTHSHILLTSSLSQFETIALRSSVLAFFNTWGSDKLISLASSSTGVWTKEGCSEPNMLVQNRRRSFVSCERSRMRYP